MFKGSMCKLWNGLKALTRRGTMVCTTTGILTVETTCCSARLLEQPDHLYTIRTLFLQKMFNSLATPQELEDAPQFELHGSRHS
jgi:hypothetical protein